MAHGAPLLLLRAEASHNRSLQSAPKISLLVRDRAGRVVRPHGPCRVEAGAVFLAGMDDGRIPPGAGVAFRRDVGNSLFLAGTSRDGRAAWLEEFHVHAHGMENRSGIHATLVCAEDFPNGQLSA